MINICWNQISSEIHTDPLQQASFQSQGSWESNIAHPQHQTVEHKSNLLSESLKGWSVFLGSGNLQLEVS
jgi:hypothetical protein